MKKMKSKFHTVPEMLDHHVFRHGLDGVLRNPRVLISFVRKEKTEQPKGVVVAVGSGSEFALGWSLCHRLDKNDWDRKFALDVAIGRACRNFTSEEVAKKSYDKLPQTLEQPIDQIFTRAKNYFRDPSK